MLFEAYRYTTVCAATLSYYFAPTLVTVACSVLYKEKLTKKQLVCFIMSTLGVVLVVGLGDSGQSENNLVGILFGLGAAVFYASVILINKYIKGVGGIHRTFLQFLAAVATLIPYVAATSGFSIFSLNTEGWVNLLILGLFHTGITYCMYFTALKELPGQQAAILSYIDPAVAVLVSVVFLKEKVTMLQIIGGILILGFAILNELPAKKKN